MMKIRSLFFLLTVLSFSAFAQIEKHAQWKFTVSKSALKVGGSLEITIEANIDEGWYLYSTDYDPKLDAPHASITFEGTGFKESGTVKAIGAKEKFDEIWGGNIKIFTGKATFKQKLIITKSNPQITVNVDGQVCSHVSGLCVRVKETYLFNDIKASGQEISAPDTGKIKTDTSKVIVVNDTVRNKRVEGTQNLPFTIENIEEGKHESLVYFLITAFIFGFVSLLTPCVFPMVPLTVTFFTNASLTRRQAVSKGIVYGISIVLIFTLVGLIFGASLANVISTHWLPNILFFIVFIF
ncbi:MAG TPA: protein-disulfide reductase DsbD domain-containing protein, partial [Cytophagaceae bacterium]|nr:protein-disulfide reductase DsbD domain-containing protein [Cytophagaceae bacterium]